MKAGLWAWLAFSVLAISTVSGWVATRAVKDGVREGALSRLRREVRLLASKPLPESPEVARNLVKDAARHLAARVTLITKSGTVLADSTADDPESVASLDNHAERPEILAAARSGFGETLRTSRTTGVTYEYLAGLVLSESGGFVRVALPIRELETTGTTSPWWFVLTILPGLALVAGLAVVIFGPVLKPIKLLSNEVERVTAGESHQAITVPEGDALRRLGVAVSGMRDRLVGKVAELENERQLLASVTDGMAEGLLLVGPERRVLLINAAFRRIFRVADDAEGRPLLEVVRHPVVDREIDLAFSRGEERRETVTGTPGSDRSFQLHATPVTVSGLVGRKGVLVLFFDITRLEALERVRRQFVADVTHELRTPLTSIKAAVETLLNGALEEPESARRFLEVAERQSSRMGDLLADLTDLSQIETGSILLDIRRLDIREVVDDVVGLVSTRHLERAVNVRVDIENGVTVLADRRRLEQVLVNLVDNAVKYSPAGSEVRISARSDAAQSEIAVEDKGPGIPEDCQERVFQRFFRVDKGRSREAGGTGLGLAIVKHLIMLHHGTVRVKSQLGRGTRFIVELPYRPDA